MCIRDSLRSGGPADPDQHCENGRLFRVSPGYQPGRAGRAGAAGRPPGAARPGVRERRFPTNRQTKEVENCRSGNSPPLLYRRLLRRRGRRSEHDGVDLVREKAPFLLLALQQLQPLFGNVVILAHPAAGGLLFVGPDAFVLLQPCLLYTSRCV